MNGMIRYIHYPILVLGLLLAPALSPAATTKAASTDPWKGVEEAIKARKPRTALELLAPIQESALASKNWGLATHAIARKAQLEASLEGRQPEEGILRLNAALETAPPEIKPLLQALLADWYWSYFQRNRWRFMQRSRTAEAPGKDFTTWDLPRLFSEIDRTFTRALSADAALKGTPVSQFNETLSKGTLPDTQRPTLYDFIAFKALEFYTSGEQAGARPETIMELYAEQPVYGVIPLFGSAEEFATSAKIERNANESPAERALWVYLDLTLFHLKDTDPSALMDVELHRLRWAKTIAVGDNNTGLYLTALDRLLTRWPRHSVSSQVHHAKARTLWEQGDAFGAHAIAAQGAALNPQSIGSRQCRALVSEIEAPSSSLTLERVWPADGKPSPEGIHIRYKNLTHLWFRAYPIKQGANEFEAPAWSEEIQARLLASPPVAAWDISLPPTTNYLEQSLSASGPAGLPAGRYHIVASHSRDFALKKLPLLRGEVWVSDLALLVRMFPDRVDGFVLHQTTGEPLPGARVEIWQPNDQWKLSLTDTLNTDASGYFLAKPTKNGHPTHLKASHQGQSITLMNPVYAGHESPEPERDAVFLFTDRGLYRPGQTVHYKGIGLRLNDARRDYKLSPGSKVQLQFLDPQGKSIATVDHVCNDFGSFSGSFVAPASGLRGSHTLQADSAPQDQIQIQVEEYKRPKFEVQLAPPKDAGRLGETVSVRGSAQTYAASPVDGAKVSWRVVREVQFPPWVYWFRYRGPSGASQEIAHGKSVTRADGTFEISFVSKPDLKVPATNNPSFTYTVHADVTDPAGETRSAVSSIRLGYTAMDLRLDAASWQTPTQTVTLTLGSRTLDGQPLSSEGLLRVHVLQSPRTVQRRPLQSEWFDHRFASAENTGESVDLSNFHHWSVGKELLSVPFHIPDAGTAEQGLTMKPGVYRVSLESKDRFGKAVVAQHDLLVIDPAAERFAPRLPNHLDAPAWQGYPGRVFEAVWGTGYERGRAFVEWIHRGQVIQAYWTKPGRTQQRITLPITEAMRGGLTLMVTQQREGRSYRHQQPIEVPWDNQELNLQWEHFTSKLLPGAQESWTLVLSPKTNQVTGIPFEKRAAELMATLYDASLDSMRPHNWRRQLEIFHQEPDYIGQVEANARIGFAEFSGQWPSTRTVDARYREFTNGLSTAFGLERFDDLARMVPRYSSVLPGRKLGETLLGMEAAPAAAMDNMPALAKARAARPEAGGAIAETKPTPPRTANTQALDQVQSRRALQETAFFMPHLTTDTNGSIRMTFTMPETLTTWRFMAFAHDRSLRSGALEGKTVTAKELMVQPNAPRFVREGDQIEFTVKISNSSDHPQTGKARLLFTQLETGASADAALQNQEVEKAFEVPAKQSRTLSWPIHIPDGMSFLSYRVVAASEAASDGEEGPLPVLSRRVLITESLPLPLRGAGVRQFQFTNLIQSANSPTLKHQSLTLQMVSQPAWYAVMALPYLMEYPHECAEQTFNRYYANALAQRIALSDPKMRKVFDAWKGTASLKSPLEMNADLKSVMLEETPWLRDAQSEGQARQTIGKLFDDDRLNSELVATLAKLQAMRAPSGLWPWFTGGPANPYISLYIATGFGRLRHLGVDVALPEMSTIWRALDLWMEKEKADAVKNRPDENHLTHSIALYLYGRSFFLKDIPLSNAAKSAVDYWLKQSRTYWTGIGSRQCEGQLALALQRWGDTKTPTAIVNSLRERALHSEEMGMYWRDSEYGWWWYQAPIETQAMMIEVFEEVARDAESVDACQVWLLKQKQTQAWKSTRATADAVFALLLRGSSPLSRDALVEVTLDGKNVSPSSASAPSVEAGTGFYEVRVAGADVRPAQGEVTTRKSDDGVSWGSLHWQYFEELGHVKGFENTPLKLKKALFVRENTTAGPVLRPVDKPLNVGDELVIRLELRVDRDLEFVHLKDQRGSGTEPVNVLSGYRWQDGLGYYESTRDTANHYFLDHLRRGTYVFEHSARVQLRGEYQTGVAEIQCLYAPEFNSHSESVTLRVQ